MEEEKIEIFLTDEEATTAKYPSDLVARIDSALLAQTSPYWRKSARVVGYALLYGFPDVPEAYFVDRIIALVSQGELEAQGNLRLVRFSEVRQGTPVDVREETPSDAPVIHSLIHAAFGKEAEANLVDTLRQNGDLSLSLVAIEREQIVGHVSLSPMSINGAVGLAPLAVAPASQKRGVGKTLMHAAIWEARRRKMDALFVLGSDKYYPRFGFVPAKQFGISCVYPDSENHFFAMELRPGALNGRSGLVSYAPAFDKL